MLIKKLSSIAITAASLMAFYTPVSTADIVLNGQVKGNVAATSSYIWRGAPQTLEAAIQGGLSYQDPGGVHASAWTSSLALGDTELDLTFGFSGMTNGIKYDAGVILYQYSQEVINQDFEEFYVGVTKGALGAKFSTSSDIGDYIEIGASLPVKKWTMSLHFGHYSVDSAVGQDYADYNVTFSKNLPMFDVSFMLSDTDQTGDSFRTVVTVSKDFKP